MSEETVVILAGIGGQGIQVTGKTLAHAAVYEEKRALFYSLFDGAQRGGVSDCIVAISPTMVQAPPLLKQPCSVLLAMDPNGLKRYQSMVRPGGLIVYNQSINEVSRFRYADMHDEEVVDEARPDRTDVATLELAATHVAKERLDAPLMASLLCLGGLIEMTKVVNLASAKQALRDSIRPGRHSFIGRSMEALDLGAAIARGEAETAASRVSVPSS